MPASILANCRCGRTLRAREEQIGSTVRCWDCGCEVPVAQPAERLRLAGSMAGVLRDSFRWPAVGRVAAGAGVLTLALLVPWAGPWVALALAAWGVWFYGAMVRASGLENPAADPAVVPGRGARFGRFALGAAWAGVLVAPLLARHGGYVMPVRGPTGWARALMALAFVGWLVMPVVLLAAYAHDRRGPLTPRQALAALRRHPGATLAALLVAPLGLVAVEALLVALVWFQGLLPLMVADLFPPALLSPGKDGMRLIYQYDHLRIVRPITEDAVLIFPVYLSGLSRGFTLLGSIPASLTSGLSTRLDPEFFRWSAGPYLGARALLSTLALTGVGLLLSVQAQWLGLIASRGARRSARPAPAASPAPIPVPAPAPLPGIVPAPPRPAAVVPPPPLPSPSPSAFGNGMAYGGVLAGPGASHLPASAAVAVPPGPGPGPGPGPSRPRILIIEDETPVAEALARILVSRGYGVTLAGDGEEGLRQARAGRPDVIVLDLLLPNKSGAEVCRELRADASTRAIPIVMATAADTDADELAGLAVGADDYVAKPYSVDVLIARIQKQLLRRQG